MSSNRVHGPVVRLADQAIVNALKQGPLSVRELSDLIRRIVCEAWSEKHGYDFDWFTDEEPLGARLLATCEAREQGFLLSSHEIHRRLRSLERRGHVERIQIEGHRPMLWRVA